MIDCVKKELCDIADCVERYAVKRGACIADKAKKIIRESYAENIGVEQIAHKMGLSMNYVGQLFKTVTGLRVTEYITLLRIERAKELLVNSNHKIYEISDAVGYNDQYYFSAVFKKYISVSPKEFRKYGG
jgi:two-component system response regulator YesN